MAATFSRARSAARTALPRALSAVRSGVREAASRDRLLLAAKTALAAGLAWAVAQFMPGFAAKYPYYAPLGALVSMYSTVADSLRNGLQSLAGLALGIGVAMLIGSFTGTSAVAVAIVVGIGVLVGGLPRMGTASEWVPLAALFVLVAGPDTRDDFSLAYLLQMAVGVGIGFAVNWLIFPPLNIEAVTPAFARLRHTLADQLDDMALAATEEWPPDHRDWSTRDGVLAETTAEVRHSVERAEVSARANPRRKLHRRDLAADLADLRAVERVTFQVQDITDILSSVIWEERAGTTVPPELTPELATALTSTAEVLRGWGESPSLPDRLDDAQGAIDSLSGSFHEAAHETSVSATASIALALSRVVRAVRERQEAQEPARGRSR